MLFIGVSGGSGAGKTSFVKKISEKLSDIDMQNIPLDNYYRDHSHIAPEDLKNVNFDHPEAIDFELLIQHIKLLKNNKPVEMPQYSYITCKRDESTVQIFPKRVIIIEGILTFTNMELNELLDLKIFIDSDADLRLSRMLIRDINERERDYKEVLRRYEEIVKPMHNKYIEPSRKYADFIIPNEVSDEISTNFIVSMIKNRLNKD